MWGEVKGEFSVKFDNKEIAAAALDATLRFFWRTSLVFNLAPGAGVLYIDDMKIIEK